MQVSHLMESIAHREQLIRPARPDSKFARTPETSNGGQGEQRSFRCRKTAISSDKPCAPLNTAANSTSSSARVNCLYSLILDPPTFPGSNMSMTVAPALAHVTATIGGMSG
ncbi:hypothetical protein PC116_g20614 [Phytophthora cactorum]|uniref:Uncharacterized protein n=1 Tax=Phytophthora cactorum TaxID=29920 RepID=A0A8T1AIW4_9STRA|nr:hypothetical protein PC112_g9197 [Phytophthora cactorum]KAG2882184.1 hypothetical protein PC115_g22015 [Phytophthora cactorum]KAG2905051.1 hypothetical protein PC114_g11645 [Phytophthora cactorum]KAG2958791.1 hypothetical protein PC118_g23345 [Phytophthora cactorum]KAG2998293.1 hypothetical protein PC120_g21184 [Phytophthora cactorum]